MKKFELNKKKRIHSIKYGMLVMPECYPIKPFGYKLYRASITNNHGFPLGGIPLGGIPLGGIPLKGNCSAKKSDYVWI